MKLSKTLMASALVLACASMANATTIYITGSTAFRSAAQPAIVKVLSAGGAVNYGYIGTSFSGASQAIFTGTISGQFVTVKTSWTGSEAGIASVAGNLTMQTTPSNQAFLADSTPMSTAGTANASSSLLTDTHVPDVDFSDTMQSSSQFYNTTLLTTVSGTQRPVTYGVLQDADNGSGSVGPVGIVPFKWVATPTATTADAAHPMTNVTSKTALAMINAGLQPLSLFNGISADNATNVYLTGRNPDSGTRLTAFAEAGTTATAPCSQWMPSTVSSATATVSNAVATYSGTFSGNSAIGFIVFWPQDLVNGIKVSQGNSGYSSGGNLVKALCNIPPTDASGNPQIIIGYAGAADADTVLGNSNSNLSSPITARGLVELSYNGVFLGQPVNSTTHAIDYNLATNLLEGQYTFWGYEHIYYRPSAVGTIQATFANALAQDVYNVDALVLINNMDVQRTADGGPITSLNY